MRPRGYSEAVGGDSRGFEAGLTGRAAIWARTGVGLVRDMESARSIVNGVRRKAVEVLSIALKLWPRLRAG